METTTKDIRTAFFELRNILEKANTSYYMINEKYGEDQAKLFEAGFWDKLKTGASKVGSFFGKTAGSATNIGKSAVAGVKQAADTVAGGVKQAVGNVVDKTKLAYQKGAELGNKALDAVKNVAGKISDFFGKAWEGLMNAPEAFWNKMKEGWNTVADEFVKLKETAGDKFQLNVGLILEDLNKKLCKKLRELTGDKQMGDYAIARKRPSDFKGKYAKFSGTLEAVAKELVNSKSQEAKEFGQKLLESLKQGSQDVGMFLLGLIVAPFYAIGWAGKKLFNLGMDFGQSVEGFIKTAKTEVPEIWNEFKSGVKTGYQEKTAPTNPPTNPTPTAENKILRFKEFVNERKN